MKPDTLRAAISEAKSELENLRKKTRETEELYEMLRKQCVDHHFVEAPELFCAHKNEDYDRCTICGVVR